MNSGLLVIVALFLIYVAVTGKHKCVSAAARCIFSGAQPCDCSQTPASAPAPATGQGSSLPIPGRELGKSIGQAIKDAILGTIKGGAK